SHPSAIRNTARFASSGISPLRPIGMALRDSPRLADCGLNLSHAPLVGKGPGAIAFRRMPFGPHSVASDLVMTFKPAFDIADGTVNGPPFHIHVVRIEITLALLPPSIQRLPQPSVTQKLPGNTISAIELNPRGLNSFVREMKFPAALFT